MFGFNKPPALQEGFYYLDDRKTKIRLGSVNRAPYLDKYYAKNFELREKSGYFTTLIV